MEHDNEELTWHFERGKRDFNRNAPMPKQPPDDEDRTPRLFYWLGYMTARGREMLRQTAVRRYIEEGIDLE